MSSLRRRSRARRISPAELDAIVLPARHNGGPPLDEPAPSQIYRPAAPALIFPRTVLRYRGLWNGADDFHGRLLVEGRAGHREWVDLQALLDGGWDGQPPTTAMLSHSIGLWMAAGVVVVVPGSQTFTAPGSLVIQPYNRFEGISVGAGGGGGGASSTGTFDAGDNGDSSTFASSTPLVGNGGEGGGGAGTSIAPDIGDGGAGGTASGGTTNSTGSAGAPGDNSPSQSGAGGTRNSYTGTLLTYTQRTGGALRSSDADGADGAAGGAGGSGGNRTDTEWGGGGGAAGLSARLWNLGDAGAPSFGASITVTVAGTAAGGVGSGGTGRDGGGGGRGEVQTAWD